MQSLYSQNAGTVIEQVFPTQMTFDKNKESKVLSLAHIQDKRDITFCPAPVQVREGMAPATSDKSSRKAAGTTIGRCG